LADNETAITGDQVQKVSTSSERNLYAPRRLFGRRIIYSAESKITDENVVKILDQAYQTHLLNRGEIDYLWKYYKGDQPILARTKEVRPEINNQVVENRAAEIVDFKVGYSYGEPIQYVAKTDDDAVSEDVDALNDYMDIRSRASVDMELAKWQMVCGQGYKLSLPSEYWDDDAPFDLCIPDPRDAFVIYGNDVRHRPLAGVVYTTDPDTKVITFGVYTRDKYYEISGGTINSTQAMYLGGIPLIEYPLNTERIGAFEVVLGMLDAINKVDSNRLDGIEQFIQSLAVAVNCQFKEGTTANQIRQAGMIVLKSVGENKADFKILTEQLNQSETQTLKDDMLTAVREICGMPSQGNAKTGDSSNNGAVILRNGWQAAEARAKSYEMMFRKSEMEFLKILITYCGMELKRKDVQIKFTRRQYEDIYTKAQVLNLLLSNNLVHPKVAYTVSNMFSDVEDAYKMGLEWKEKLEKAVAEVQKAENNQGDPNQGGEGE
jgi:SPP1 family phage portal protein